MANTLKKFFRIGVTVEPETDDSAQLGAIEPITAITGGLITGATCVP